jgi:hypothetical protein
MQRVDGVGADVRERTEWKVPWMMKYKGKYWVKEQKGYRGRKGQGGYLVPS